MGVILYLSTMNAKAGWIHFIPSHTISPITTIKLSSQLHQYFQSTLWPSGVPIKICKFLSNLHVSYVTSISFTFILSLWYVVRAISPNAFLFIHQLLSSITYPNYPQHFFLKYPTIMFAPDRIIHFLLT